MPSADLVVLTDVASPQRKRVRVDTEAPLSIRALREVETCISFHVLSNSIHADCSGDPSIRGPLGFHGAPRDCHRARLIQLSWASGRPGEAPHTSTERSVRIPEVIEEGEPLGEVLLAFADALLQASAPHVRVVTYDMELNVGILLKEMQRCQLLNAQEILERAVRTRGIDLKDPTVYAWLTGMPPSYPALHDLAQVMPPGQRGFPEFRTGADEVALYLHFTAGLRELGMTTCELDGHIPVRVSRGCLRDNGVYSHDCARCGCHLD